ncbi:MULTISPECIES: helix-turn-helix domain-containing protein [Streptomyces]|uniref:HTH cro/C1-type domain-containing protein n=1 Tax=Streptomyces canarius TaxID=285453 RepID=A0ABQ3DA60_9ACTN|nr:helix-turn-helix transcriptional regulator [Streptomyces canarius]GHA69086.1 hypothetical protein GCM10010345_85850 [Streptomyces canarius]
MTNEFGPLLRRLRHKAGMTQEALAERTGVDLRTVRELESGERVRPPRVTTVRLLADALGLPPEKHEELVAAASARYAEPVAGQHALVLDETLTDVAELLAHEVTSHWRRQEEQQQIHDPYPLPVHWRPVTEHSDSSRAVRHLLAGDALGRPDLSELFNGFEGIVDVYRRIPAGRLVVLGRSGSGKSTLAVRFVLDHLQSRRHADAVPVLFSIGSWDPTAMTFRDWLTEQLTHNHPFLAARGSGGSSLAAALVEAGWVLPVLDGFDEIADGLRRPVLEALNAMPLPLLLTSRPSAYAAAVRESDVLADAVVVELTDLTLDDLAHYLPRTMGEKPGGNPAVASWGLVLNELRMRPHSRAAANLRAVLTTPLMVALARNVYSYLPAHDPSELLDTERFSNSKALEAHLLGSFTAAVYERFPGRRAHRRYDPERAQHWLGYLAHHMTQLGTSGLEWWRLGHGLRRTTRMLVTVLVICLAVGFVGGPVGVLFVPLGLKLVDGPVAGLLAGLVFGTLYCFVIAVKYELVAPSGVRMKIDGRAREARQRTLRRVAIGLLSGLVLGFGYGFVTPALTGVLWHIGLPAGLRLGLGYGVIYGLAFGMGAGVTFGLLTLFETPIDIWSAVNPVGLLRSSRRTVAFQLLAWAPTFGLLVGLVAGLVDRPLSRVLGPLVWTPSTAFKLGVISGLGVALGYAFSLTAWGQWVVFVRIWLPLTGRLPWSVVTFLEDAHQRGVLRQAGAVYQFRHPELQYHLSRVYSQRHLGQLRDALAEQRQAPQNGEGVEENRMVDARRISPWVIFSIAVAFLLFLSWISIRDILENLQIHGSLGPSDAPAVVTAVVSLATAVGALVGGTLTGLSKYVQARGQAYAEKTRADADMLRALTDARRAVEGLPSLETPPEGGTPSPQPNPSE